jgi:hypothetical protein
VGLSIHDSLYKSPTLYGLLILSSQYGIGVLHDYIRFNNKILKKMCSHENGREATHRRHPQPIEAHPPTMPTHQGRPASVATLVTPTHHEVARTATPRPQVARWPPSWPWVWWVTAMGHLLKSFSGVRTTFFLR